jgi:hypothetical protein
MVDQYGSNDLGLDLNMFNYKAWYTRHIVYDLECSTPCMNLEPRPYQNNATALKLSMRQIKEHPNWADWRSNFH